MTRRRAVYLLAACIAGVACIAVFLAWNPRGHPGVGPAKRVGNTECLSCHQDMRSFAETGHNLSSAAATAASIHGSFREGEDVLKTSNPGLQFRMDSTARGFYQTALMGVPPTDSASARFDIVIGSGRKGQTYLHWKDSDRLFQLPVSYWTELKAWVNSPGYPDGTANFSRPVTPRCLECHASSFEAVGGESNASNQYRRANYSLGIGCETCHGAGQEHVERERSRIPNVLGHAIVNPAKLSRARELDGCALCHGGLGEPQAPAFSYVPGRPLEDYLHLNPPLPGEERQEVDVHGNQVALLAKSPCFRASDMTCSTCHNVHQTQRNAASFSSSCLGCHKVQSCGLFPEKGHKLAENCVDCHMPNQTSNTIVSTHEGQRSQPKVRNHWIKVYPATGKL